MLWGENRGKWKGWQSPGIEPRTPGLCSQCCLFQHEARVLSIHSLSVSTVCINPSSQSHIVVDLKSWVFMLLVLQLGTDRNVKLEWAFYTRTPYICVKCEHLAFTPFCSMPRLKQLAFRERDCWRSILVPVGCRQRLLFLKLVQMTATTLFSHHAYP